MNLDDIKNLKDAARELPGILDNLYQDPTRIQLVSGFVSLILAYDKKKKLLSKELYERSIAALRKNDRGETIQILERQVRKHNYFPGVAV